MNKKLEKDFPCINCITFVICRNRTIEYIRRDPRKDNMSLYYILWDVLAFRCDILKNYIIRNHRVSIPALIYNEKIGEIACKVFKE